MSLFLAGEDPKQINVSHGFLQFINFLASLLHTVCRIAEEELDNQGWQIVIAFLWSTWQRSVMLYLWCISRFHLLEGFDADNTTPKLALISLPTHLLKLRCNDHMNKADYMCNWAFELLRNDAGSKALDFRTFHQRFNTKFGNINPRLVHLFHPCDPFDWRKPLTKLTILSYIGALRGQMDMMALYVMDHHLCTVEDLLVGGGQISRYTTQRPVLANQCFGTQSLISVCEVRERYV